MGKQEKIKEITKRLVDCRKELESIRDDISSSEYQKVKASINSSISFLNRASKQITELLPMEGQMSIFDYQEDCDFDYEMET